MDRVPGVLVFFLLEVGNGNGVVGVGVNRLNRKRRLKVGNRAREVVFGKLEPPAIVPRVNKFFVDGKQRVVSFNRVVELGIFFLSKREVEESFLKFGFNLKSRFEVIFRVIEIFTLHVDESALAIETINADAYNDIAVAYFRQKKYDDAWASLEKAAAQSSTNPVVQANHEKFAACVKIKK